MARTRASTGRTRPNLRPVSRAGEIPFALARNSRAGLENDRIDGDGDGNDIGTRVTQSRQEWLAVQRDNRCVQVSGDSMSPIVAEGASVAYATNEEDVRHLDGKMVVAWVENQPVIRWFQHCGRYAFAVPRIPRPSPSKSWSISKIPASVRAFRRVLWINTPH